MTAGSLVFGFQVVPFVILFVERSGSTYLITALKSHPGVLALTEKFDALRQEGRDGAEQVDWARSFLSPPFLGRHRAIGFKTKTIDILDPDGFAALVQQRRCRIIKLHRQNTVKAVVSTINARRQHEVSGNWNLLNEKTRLPAFEVDPAEFAALLAERERLDAELAAYAERLGLPTLALTYEDLLQDPATFVSRSLEFLGAGAARATGATLKNTKDDLRQAILNFDALRARYAGTRYESMFDEVVTA